MKTPKNKRMRMLPKRLPKENLSIPVGRGVKKRRLGRDLKVRRGNREEDFT